VRLLLAQPTDDLERAVQGLTAWDWIRAGIIFAAAIVLAFVVQRALRRLLDRAGEGRVSARVVARIAAYVVVAVGFIYALGSLDVPITPLFGALGVGGIALAFALQDTMENLLSGIFLETRNMFRRGDQIETNGYQGVVEDLNLRNVILRTFDGERVFLPNSLVIQNPITNYTAFGPRRTNLIVGMPYDVDLARAQRVMLAAVQGVEGVLDSPEPEALVEAFGDSSIEFVVRFWHQPGRANLFWVRDAVAQSLKRSLDEAGISIPFPQRTVWFAPKPASSDG
jgi:small-conductance mechanosensitive channel